MGRLTESVQGLRDAIKRQETQLSKFMKSGGLQGMNLEPNRKLNENKKLYDILEDQLQYDMKPVLHSVGSEISNISNWSCNLDTINSSIEDLKHVLKNQDKQVIALLTENEDLKNELKKKEKELKKQKFLLKAERETFEQYKKDTFGSIKKQQDCDESDEIKPDKTSKEILKLKSELAHFRHLYGEQRHTLARMSKMITSLKEDKIQLKEKLLQQEKQYSKFIMEMAQRFNVSRKEFNLVTSKKFETSPISPTNIAVCKMADRNARLAYDNCMLKLEVNELREKVFTKKTEENKLQCFKMRPDFDNGKDVKRRIDIQEEEATKCCPLKATTSEKSGLSVNTNLNVKSAVKTSVTSLIERNSETVPTWSPVVEKSTVDDTNFYKNAINISGVDSAEVMRTESAPQLRLNNNKHKEQ